jgi:hypothetical protein
MMAAGKMTPMFIGSMGHMKSSFLKSIASNCIFDKYIIYLFIFKVTYPGYL